MKRVPQVPAPVNPAPLAATGSGGGDLGDDYIPAGLIPKLIPSCKTGKRIALSTIYRWILKGKLPAVRRGRYFFVRRSDLEKMFQPVQVPVKTGRTAREEKRAKEWTDAVLKRFGL